MASGMSKRPLGDAASRAADASSPSHDREEAVAVKFARRRARKPGSAMAATPAKGSTAASAASAAFPAAVVVKILVFLAVTGLIGYGTMSMRGHEEDPHYFQARRILRDYELGKDPASFNYEDPSYAEALSELALVDPGSISARPASDLTNDINARILKFRERIQADNERVDRDRAAEAARNAAILQAQIASTGVDPGAAARTTAMSKKECLEDQHPHPKRSPALEAPTPRGDR